MGGIAVTDEETLLIRAAGVAHKQDTCTQIAETTLEGDWVRL